MQQVQIAGDDLQQIVEVMRDAAGELAQRLHLLRLAQRGFGFGQGLGVGAVPGHVAGDAIDEVALGHGGPAEDAIIAPLGAEPVFEPDGRMAVGQILHLAARPLHIVGMLHPFRCAADQFLLRPAQYVGPGGAGGQPDALAVGDQEGVARQRPEAVAVGACLALGQHAHRGFADDAQHAAD